MEACEEDFIFLLDDNFLTNKQRLERLCEELEERKLGKYWMTQGRTDFIAKYPELIARLADVGLAGILSGYETNDEDALEGLNKRNTLENNRAASRILRENGILSTGIFMVRPDFEEKDFDALYAYIEDLGVTFPLVTILTPLPGTEMYRKYEDQLLTKDFRLYDLLHPVIETKLPREEFYKNFTRYRSIYRKNRNGWLTPKVAWRRRDFLRKLLPGMPRTIIQGLKYQKIQFTTAATCGTRPASSREAANTPSSPPLPRPKIRTTMSLDAHSWQTWSRSQTPGVNHTFLARVGTSPFTREDYKVFGLQHTRGRDVHELHGAPVRQCPDTTSKCWLAKVLVDEYGRARMATTTPSCTALPTCHKCSLVRKTPWCFTGRTGLHPHAPGAVQPVPLPGGPRCPRTGLIRFRGRLRSSRLERAGFEDEEINYFKLHIDQDEDHAIWLEEALASMIQTQEEADQVREGTLLSLEARRRFGEGVQEQVVQWRQPAKTLALAEKTRQWMGGQHEWLGSMSTGLAVSTAVFRLVHDLAQRIPIR